MNYPRIKAVVRDAYIMGLPNFNDAINTVERSILSLIPPDKLNDFIESINGELAQVDQAIWTMTLEEVNTEFSLGLDFKAIDAEIEESATKYAVRDLQF